ncbi:hypothetical protein KR084_005239, partial [Drosophila pseudotakahashii]
FYFGINFWDTFGLTFLGKGGTEFAAIEAPPEYDLMTGDLDMNDPPKPVTAYMPHQLSPEQHSKLRRVIETYPSCLDKGLGKTSLEQHIIEVTNEDLPIKQRHYPISPAKQKLVYAELDRMIGLGVIEESNSSWSSPVTLARYLGYVVGGGCIRTDDLKIQSIQEFPQPSSPKQMRRFLGMTGWYRRFIQNYAQTAAPLHDCLKKDRVKKFELSEEAIQAFEELKANMASAPVLLSPDFKKPFTIQCDTSTNGVGGVLFQTDDSGG